MAKQKTGGRKRGAQQDYHGTTSAAPAVAPGAGGLGPDYGAAGAKDAGSVPRTECAGYTGKK